MATAKPRVRRFTAGRAALVLTLLAALGLSTGCPEIVKPEWPTPGTVTPGMGLLRDDSDGPILLGLTERPLEPNAPVEGVRRALERTSDTCHSAAALFPAAEKAMAWRWLEEQFGRRIAAGETPELILVGHGIGGAQAAEMAKRVIKARPEVRILLLATIDAVKANTMTRSAGFATGMVDKANPIAAARLDLIAYGGAPRVDGSHLLAHVNYYQMENALLHGGPMDGATLNQRLTGPAGAVTHENADQHAQTFLAADIANALRK